ncbi:hypothetical protein GP475_08360 [Corynebacterium poyangense]|uniref:Uncharacterized protein n=1 Tax=Corynebacterium poyangense TaxID=2684405 RepID=A0A7H0SQ22_9CORY|nr:hypothetical protein [Corynebacterium poyangense]MBZ8178421.1 hypothetical protein [Corynebacterium poyangense]QNQ90647.1 hypothetical protein GP475_08360 [Corynebacterium poyangense]
MPTIAAELRHRELTQELYDIGDEVAGYLENLSEALHDWDAELVADCLAELEEISSDAIRDSRLYSVELAGLRRALTSGRKRGVLSVRDYRPHVSAPEFFHAAELEDRFPLRSSPLSVHDLASTLEARTSTAVSTVQQYVEFCLDQTAYGIEDLGAVDLPRLYRRIEREVRAVACAWLTTVAEAHPGYTRTMRGHHPPEFLHERARIAAVVDKINARRQQGAKVSGGNYAS